MTAIRKFNKYCEKLAILHQPVWNLPLPQPLPTKLSALRDASNLMEDVWITRQQGMVPRWLESLDVREGIRAMLKVDRCLEERRRLGMEADNLCRWFGRELVAIEYAMTLPASEYHENILLMYLIFDRCFSVNTAHTLSGQSCQSQEFMVECIGLLGPIREPHFLCRAVLTSSVPRFTVNWRIAYVVGTCCTCRTYCTMYAH